MKPISVSFKCFGPYVKEQTVNFSELNSIFVISGETGSGKTTILDAMCYALYGSSSSGERGEFEKMRCQQAEKKDDTFVKFTFEENGKIYCFSRSYAMARSKFTEKYECTENGEPMKANIGRKTVSELAEQILHLNANQFRQTIILPQGKFETFLVADSKEKEAVLESIFAADRWGAIADRVAKAVDEREKELKDKGARLKTLLADHDCANEEQLGAAISDAKTELEELKTKLERTKEELKAAQKARDAAIADNDLFAELDKRARALQELSAEKAHWNEEEQRLGRVDAAQEISGLYDRFISEKSSAEKAAKKLDDAEKKHTVAKKALTAAMKKQQEHLMHEGEQSDRKERRILLINARSAYESIEEIREAFENAARDAESAARAAKTAESVLKKAEKARNDALNAYDESNRHYSEAVTAYRAGVAGELAAELRENKPCPVCGSCHHPAPAVRGDASVSKEQLDKLESDRDTAKKVWDTAEKKLIETKAEEEKKKRTAAEATSEKAAKEAALKAAEKNLIEGIKSAADLEQEIQVSGGKIDLFETEKSDLQDKVTNAVAAEKSAADALETAKKDGEEARRRFEDASSEWTAALSGSVFADEKEFLSSRMEPKERDRLKDNLAKYKAELASAKRQHAEQEKLCADKIRPDVNALKEKLNAVSSKKDELIKTCSSLQIRLEQLQNDFGEYQKQRPLLDKERGQMDVDRQFADRLRDNRGVNLKRYVLGAMMSAILRQANSFLSTIYGGRYRLRRGESTAKNTAAGLELAVYDSQTNETRGVNSLSGGEKFLVSLALAIGLSVVVQLQGRGVHMDAMFVDEGFGSLDNKSVEEAVSVLEQARGRNNANGVVGVITHVEQVVKIIGNGLEAVKSKDGNSLRPIGTV